MKFAYKAYDKAGKIVTDAIDAASPAEASELLRKQGMFATEIHRSEGDSGADGGGRAGGGRGSRGAGGKTKRLKAMAAFVRQLSILVATGTPIVEAISSLEKQTPSG